MKNQREDNISPGLGGISWSGGRLGHSHTIWSQVPRHEQPSQTQSVVGKFSQRPPSAAGEKEAKTSTPTSLQVLLPAKCRVFFQSMRWKYWPEKRSISWSLRLEATCRQRHQAHQAFRTMCCRKPTSSFAPKSKSLPVRSWYQTQGRTKRQPWQVRHVERARAGVPPATLQTSGRRAWIRAKTPTNSSPKCSAKPNGSGTYATTTNKTANTGRHSRRWYMHSRQRNKHHQQIHQGAKTSHHHEESLPWKVVQIVFWTNVNQAWTASACWPWRTQPKREEQEELSGVQCPQPDTAQTRR